MLEPPFLMLNSKFYRWKPRFVFFHVFWSFFPTEASAPGVFTGGTSSRSTGTHGHPPKPDSKPRTMRQWCEHWGGLTNIRNQQTSTNINKHLIFLGYSKILMSSTKCERLFVGKNPIIRGWHWQGFDRYFPNDFMLISIVQSSLAGILGRFPMFVASTQRYFMKFHYISWNFIIFHEISLYFMKFHYISWEISLYFMIFH